MKLLIVVLAVMAVSNLLEGYALRATDWTFYGERLLNWEMTVANVGLSRQVLIVTCASSEE